MKNWNDSLWEEMKEYKKGFEDYVEVDLTDFFWNELWDKFQRSLWFNLDDHLENRVL